ncbi:MAG TPA: nucleotidyltransferase domain-containing protein [Candidatus Methanoperedens sp.]
MLQEYTTYRILTLFFDQPTRYFQLREISRILKLGMPSVINHIKKLEKEGLIKKEKRGVYESYVSERNDLYRTYKRNDILLRMHESGLVDFLADEFMPDAIVLFGSCARGEDIETSDVDLMLVSQEKEVNLKKFESVLKRKISLHFEENISEIPKELLNNTVNGVVIYGYLTVFQ